MDAYRFDVLARTLSATGSRRAAMVVVGGGMGVLLGFAGIDAGEAKRKKKKRKNKNKNKGPLTTDCAGELSGPECGSTCCADLTLKCCRGVCVPFTACCLESDVVLNGERRGQCGLCVAGLFVDDRVPCQDLDPDGCTVCSGARCIPGNQGLQCGSVYTCGYCDQGLCLNPATGGAPEPLCGQGCCGNDPAVRCCRGTSLNECCPVGYCCPDGSCALPSSCPAG